MSNQKAKFELGPRVDTREDVYYHDGLLSDDRGEVIAEIEAWNVEGLGFFKLVWNSPLSLEDRVKLIEICLAEYDQIKQTQPELSTLTPRRNTEAEDNFSPPFEVRVISTHDVDVMTSAVTAQHLALTRPLDWDTITESAQGEVNQIRINAQVADFEIYPETEVGFNSIVMSHLAEINGIAQFVAQTSDKLTIEQINSMLEAVVDIFSAHFESI